MKNQPNNLKVIITSIGIVIGLLSFSWGIYANLEGKILHAEEKAYPKVAGEQLEKRIDKLEDTVNQRFDKTDENMQQMIQLQQMMVNMAKRSLEENPTR